MVYRNNIFRAATVYLNMFLAHIVDYCKQFFWYLKKPQFFRKCIISKTTVKLLPQQNHLVNCIERYFKTRNKYRWKNVLNIFSWHPWPETNFSKIQYNVVLQTISKLFIYYVFRKKTLLREDRTEIVQTQTRASFSEFSSSDKTFFLHQIQIAVKQHSFAQLTKIYLYTLIPKLLQSGEVFLKLITTFSSLSNGKNSKPRRGNDI